MVQTTPPSKNDGQRSQWLRNALQPVRRMSWLTLLITVGFGYSGLMYWVSWLQEITARQIGPDTSPAPYTHPIDAFFGLLFCFVAGMLLWFTFKIPELRQDYWVMGVAWGLILVEWGCLRLLSVLFGMFSHQLTLLLNPIGGSGRLLFAAWLWGYYRTERSSPPQQLDDAAPDAELQGPA